MNKLEIIVKLYTLQNRLDNSKLSNIEEFQVKQKYNRLLSKLKPYDIKYEISNGKVSSPEKLIKYLKNNNGFYTDFNTKKTRKPDYLEQCNVLVVLIKHMFTHLNLTQVMSYINKDHATYYNCENSISNKYDIDLKFRKMFDDIQIKLTGSKNIF